MARHDMTDAATVEMDSDRQSSGNLLFAVSVLQKK
jgi:hypothetical protein